MPVRGEFPSSKTITRHAKELGADVWHEYKKLREHYKREGLTPQEAIKRSCIELKIEEKWHDLKERAAFSEAAKLGVPITPGEMQSVIKSYKPLSFTEAEEIGDKEMSLPEQVAWAKKWVARVQNGEVAPTKFPCDGALYWFQQAIANRHEFTKVVLKVESPADGNNAYMQDMQYRFKDIEEQLKEAVKESGKRLCELEKGFAELLKENTYATA